MGLGGDLMADAGCRLYQNYREMAFMGIVAVLKNAGKVRKNFAIAKQALLQEQPEVLILIDYPSFNLKIAAFCREHLPTTRIYYYIPPKVWAWKSWRIKQICKLSYEVLGIFPFEPDFYQERGFRCRYVGNPTMDSVSRYLEQGQRNKDKEQRPFIAILPGSRKSEIANCLPTMLKAAKDVIRQTGTPYIIRVACAPGIDEAFYEPFLSEGIRLQRTTYDLLQQADAAIVNSGTATLEAALLKCPQVAVYHLAFPKLVALLRPPFERMVFRLPYFTLPNIILNREGIKELVANDFTVENVTHELSRLLQDTDYRNQQLADYNEIAQLLGKQSAADTAADIIISHNT